MSIPLLQWVDLPSWLAASARPYQAGYYAMYSSVLGGIVTDPRLMMVPMDDHLVHRGDGVFETIKFVQGGIYLLEAHLDRLFASAARIHLRPGWDRAQLRDIIVQTARAGRRRDGLLRVILARGPGGMGVNPYECPEPGLYVMAHELKPPFMDLHPGGATTCSSQIPVKASFFANIKSCNYLPNALMKKEAVDRGVDFSLAFDEQGRLAEGATENAGILTPERVLRLPPPDRILAGTTMKRVGELAQKLVDQGVLRALETAPISRQDLASCAEMFIFGTTPDVTAVVRFDDKLVGGGTPGPVYRELSRLLIADIHTNPAVRTAVDPVAGVEESC